MRRLRLFYVLIFVVSYAAFVAYLRPVSRSKQESIPVVASVMNAVRTVVPRVQSAWSVAASSAASSRAALPMPAPPVEETPAARPVPVDYSTPARALMSVERAAQEDERPESRLAAVQQLSALSLNGDNSNSIRNALQSAMSDADETVAAAARAAYNDLNARQQAAGK